MKYLILHIQNVVQKLKRAVCNVQLINSEWPRHLKNGSNDFSSFFCMTNFYYTDSQLTMFDFQKISSYSIIHEHLSLRKKSWKKLGVLRLWRNIVDYIWWKISKILWAVLESCNGLQTFLSPNSKRNPRQGAL